MKIKEYKPFKSVAKTAKENNLIVGEDIGSGKRLFDFSFLDTLDIPEEEKEIIRGQAIKYISPAFRESMYGKEFNRFHTCNGIALYQKQRVFSKSTGKRIYTIFTMIEIKHSSAHRNCVYDEFVVKDYSGKNKYILNDEDIEI